MFRFSPDRTFQSRLQGEPRSIERGLLLLAALFLFIYSTALSLSSAVRVRSWSADLRLEHWIGFGVWAAAFAAVHLAISRRLPGRDPIVLPVVGLLCGWGLLTVWRLTPYFGARQTAWLALSAALLIAGLRLPGDLNVLRRYKYVWLSGALLLAAATLLFGVNPMGYGPAMWLGCCGVYLQPSEPLKLLLIAYLAAYMADVQPLLVLEHGARPTWKRPAAALDGMRGFFGSWGRLAPLLAPTLLMTGAALAVLAVQRDLGTAAIFLFLYAAIVYLASARRSVIFTALLGTAAAGVLGYRLYDVVRVRVDAWINPWADPTGNSYQIVQSIIAIANGGIIGRGPGLGSPALAPLAHSDLIYAALAEESGFLGTVALLALIGLFAARGLRAAIAARSPYHRYLAAGLTALLAGQSILIIGGSLRLLPLTGVTLPFVSYGGSSLLTSFAALLLLLHISDRGGRPAATLYRPGPFIELGALLLVGLLACGSAAGWWAVVRNADLLTRSDNQRRYIADRYVRRGSILDRNHQPIALSEGNPGEIVRRIAYPDLSSLAGYTHPVYGQAGIEAGMDGYLRGLEGRPGFDVWLDHMLYGQPPPGLDVRLSLDLELQRRADLELAGLQGALVAMDAANGEVLAAASHPTFDANHLAEEYEALIADSAGPLFNRAVLGRYPLGGLQNYLFVEGSIFFEQKQPSGLLLPAGGSPDQDGNLNAGYSPLQVAVAAAALSNSGLQPAATLVTGVQTPHGGWRPFALSADLPRVISVETARSRSGALAGDGEQLWLTTASVASDGVGGVWAVAGTLPNLSTTPFVVAVYLENNRPQSAAAIAVEMLEALVDQADPRP